MYLFYGFLVLAIIMFIFTVVLFFLLDIKRALGDITGANKRKEISRIFEKTASESIELNASNASQDGASQPLETPQAMYDRLDLPEPSSGFNSQPKAIPKRMPYSHISVSYSDFSVAADITLVHSAEIIR